jgi:hypothetical protein
MKVKSSYSLPEKRVDEISEKDVDEEEGGIFPQILEDQKGYDDDEAGANRQGIGAV